MSEPILSEPAEPTPEPPSPQPASTPEPFKAQLGEDGNTLADGWYKGLPEEMHGTLKSVKSIEDLAKGNYGLRKQLGDNGNRVKPLTAESSAEEISAWRKAHGVPEAATPEAYGIKIPDELPQGMDKASLEARLPGYLEVLHKHNASPDLVNALIAYDMEQAGAFYEQATLEENQQAQAELDKLKSEWGNSWDQKVSGANRIANLAGIADDSPLRSSPEFARAAAQLATLIGEDKLPNAENTQTPGRMTAEEGREFAKQIQTGVGANSEALRLHALYNKGDAATITYIRQLIAGRG